MYWFTEEWKWSSRVVIFNPLTLCNTYHFRFLIKVLTLSFHFKSTDENNMRGPIPKELQHLEYIEELDFDSNSLVGHFPSWVGGMKRLQKLDIDRNVLSGPIPDELYKSTSLAFVDMNHNILSGTISTKIGQMSELVFWQFDWNQLVGTIPTEVAGLQELQYFSVFGNGFNDDVGIPRELCDLEIQLYATCGMCGLDCCTVCLPEQLILP
jgi:hypothetical protein